VNSALTRETHKGFYGLVARLYYITFPTVSRGREGGKFMLLRVKQFLALLCLFLYSSLTTLDFPLHLCMHCWAAFLLKLIYANILLAGQPIGFWRTN
jgi:hypothetical protein